MRRHLSVNITPLERVARIIVGLAGLVGAVVLFTGGPGVFAAVLEVALGLAGLDLMVTGALGHCPLYAKLGHVPTSLKSS